MNPNQFDAIVLGVGGMGSAALFELARRGRRVLGLEQFSLGHVHGSSHGHTRIIRKAYYEHPDYVPLVERAYERWRELEQLSGQTLLSVCPCLSLGRPDSELITGVQRSAAEHHLAIELLSNAELRQRYPQFVGDDDQVGVLERSAGILFVEQCVAAHIEAARRLGAVVHEQEEALSWQVHGDGVTVQTAHGELLGEASSADGGPVGKSAARATQRVFACYAPGHFLGRREQ